MKVVLMFLFEVLVLVVCWYLRFKNPSMVGAYEMPVTAIFGVVLVRIGNRFWQARNFPGIGWTLIRLLVQGKELRISFATLITIKSDNRYLLVLSDRTPRYQPPGGVLKFYDKTILQKFCLKDDASYPTVDPDELRLRFPEGKIWNLFSFLDWFDTQKGREIDPHREFNEELIDTGILDPQIFSKPQFEYVKRETPKVTYSTHFKIHELRLFEVFELQLDANQKAALKNLEGIPSSKYVFLTADEIERDGFVGSQTVPLGTQTTFVL